MDILNDLEKYDAVVGYGIGQDYERMKPYFQSKLVFDYLADKKWENLPGIQEYDGIPIIRMKQLMAMKQVLIITFPMTPSLRDTVMRQLQGVKADIYYVMDLIRAEYWISGKELLSLLPETKYEDEFHNRIIFDATIPGSIRICFFGKNSLVKVGTNLSVKRLDICCGNNGRCIIGDKISVQEAKFHVSQARLEVGEDCMFSRGIRIRTHDSHHIFDCMTHKRINYARNVRIGNKVWIGCDAVLFPGADIGTGSVIGERTVTSSQFGEYVVIAGSPAKVIRENVCWSRDRTGIFNHDWLEECADDAALKYKDGK